MPKIVILKSEPRVARPAGDRWKILKSELDNDLARSRDQSEVDRIAKRAVQALPAETKRRLVEHLAKRVVEHPSTELQLERALVKSREAREDVGDEQHVRKQGLLASIGGTPVKTVKASDCLSSMADLEQFVDEELPDLPEEQRKALLVELAKSVNEPDPAAIRRSIANQPATQLFKPLF